MSFVVSKVARDQYNWALVMGNGVRAQAWRPFATPESAMEDVRLLQRIGPQIAGMPVAAPTPFLSPATLPDGAPGQSYVVGLAVAWP